MSKTRAARNKAIGETPVGVTEVLADRDSLVQRLIRVLSNAKVGVDAIAESMNLQERDLPDNIAAVEAYYRVNERGGHLRIITRIGQENLTYCKEMSKIAELRHLETVSGNLLMNESEYMTAPGMASFFPRSSIVSTVYSNDRHLVEQSKRFFERLWSTARPAEERFKELQEGTSLPKIELIRNSARIRDVFLELIDQAKRELLVIQPTAETFRRAEDGGMLEAMVKAATERSVKISIISPDSEIQRQLRRISEEVNVKTGKKLIEHREIPQASAPNTVTVIVADRSSSLVIEQNDAPELDFTDAMDVATYSTRNSTVLANVRFFERVWEELELREREEVALEKERRSRRTAELLQDILSHDIRNYNQVVRTSGELLKEAKGGDESALIESILRATDGSTNLIERTKKLGKIISEKDAELLPVDVRESLARSAELVTKANPNKTIEVSIEVEPGTRALADDLLDEAFTNIISNSVNYTNGMGVRINASAEEAMVDGRNERYWKIALTDEGRGISEEMKRKIFTRYLRGASGGGLGLSIVYALVVERYSGKVAVSDRIPGDYRRGTKVEVWLPQTR